MNSKASGAWFRAGVDAWSLGFEASTVIGLRMAKLAAGGAAASDEAELMVAEKLRAGLELQTQLAMAPFGLTPLRGTQQALKHYRGKVAANRKRLSRWDRCSLARRVRAGGRSACDQLKPFRDAAAFPNPERPLSGFIAADPLRADSLPERQPERLEVGGFATVRCWGPLSTGRRESTTSWPSYLTARRDMSYLACTSD